jgi:Trp operon repressor
VSAIRRFANVAKRSGAPEVYAVACRELDVRDLGRLLLHLRRVDPDWKLDFHERRRLAYALLEADVSDREIRDQLEISQKTLGRRRQELVEKRKPASGTRIPKRRLGDKTAIATRRASEPVSPPWGLSADSGSVDDRPLRRLLLGGAT